jgi:hypothetical protein
MLNNHSLDDVAEDYVITTLWRQPLLGYLFRNFPSTKAFPYYIIKTHEEWRKGLHF